MERIDVRRDYAAHSEYRLLTIDKEWLSSELQSVAFQQDGEDANPHHVPTPKQRSGRRRKRQRVCLVLHGNEQLHVHGRHATDLVRRVEYSNTLLVASRDADAANSASQDQSQPPTVKVVRAALSRVFEAQKGVPQTNALSLLRDSYATIDELESTHANATAPAVGQTFTFEELARRVTCSPQELVDVLKAAGAVVLKHKLRLLHPGLVHEALRAVLVFLDGSQSVDVAWQDVSAHFCPAVYPAIVLDVVRAVYGATSTAADESHAGIALVSSAKAVVGLAGHTFETHAETTRHTVSSDKGCSVDVLSLPFDAFYDAWKNGNPDFLFASAVLESGLRESIARLGPDDLMPLLFGYVVCERPNPATYVGARVHWLPKETLTTNVALRIDVLFAVKPQRWTATELRAYVEPLMVESQAFAHTAARYAREYRVPGEPVTYGSLTG